MYELSGGEGCWREKREAGREVGETEGERERGREREGKGGRESLSLKNWATYVA